MKTLLENSEAQLKIYTENDENPDEKVGEREDGDESFEKKE